MEYLVAVQSDKYAPSTKTIGCFHLVEKDCTAVSG